MNNQNLEKHLPLMGLSIILLAVIAMLCLVLLPFFPEISQPDQLAIEMNPHYKIPALPVDSPYLPTATTVFTWGMFILGFLGTLSAAPDAIRRKTIFPLVLGLSAIVICIPEVYFDLMGAVWFPVSEETKAYTIMGRQMPWFILAGWFGFAAPFMVWLYERLRKGATAKQLWTIFIVSALASVPIEEVVLHFGQYYYYGNQPLILFIKHPFWWAPCNAGGIFLATVLAFKLEDMLQGWRSLALLFLTPMSVGAFYGFIALPSWIVVNADYSWIVTQAAGLLTVLMGIFGVSLIIRFVLQSKDMDQ